MIRRVIDMRQAQRRIVPPLPSLAIRPRQLGQFPLRRISHRNDMLPLRGGVLRDLPDATAAIIGDLRRAAISIA